MLTLIEPAGRESSYERYTFDRLDATKRLNGINELRTDDGPLDSPILDLTIGAITAEIPKAKLLDLYFEQILLSRSMFEWMLGLSELTSPAHQPKSSSLATALNAPLSNVMKVELATLTSLMDAPSRGNLLVIEVAPIWSS